MTDLTPLVKSHPSPRVRQLLASAELDVPAHGSQERALLALSHADVRAATTNFGGIALGTSVHRLLGAVTLYGSAASPWQLLARGSLFGAAVGAAALCAIVGLRWLESPVASPAVAPASQPAAPTESRPDAVDISAQQQALVRGAAVELDAGRPAVALESIEALLRANPSARVVPQAILLKTKSLLQLSRTDEAKSAAAPVLNGIPCPESLELRALLDAQAGAASAHSAK